MQSQHQQIATHTTRTHAPFLPALRRFTIALALAAFLALPLSGLPSGLTAGHATGILAGPGNSASAYSSTSHAQAPAVAVPSTVATSDAVLLAAASPLHYRRGYSVQGNSWLCYGWPSGAYHCTQRWSRVNWRYVSYNPSWVPSEGSAQTSVHATTYTVAYSAKPANTYPYGQCTFGAEQLAHDNVNGLGNARDWLWNAQRRGLPTGYTPRVGATVVFQPGVDGASWLGHVAHVVAVGSGGRFEIEAMNDAAGWGRYAFRWVQMRGGIAFIY